jgi:arylsulfatase A-like enzyme
LSEITIRRYQTISGIDLFVKHLRDMLQKESLAENTIIIFTSDHGIMEGEFGLGGKALNYEACLKIPFILYNPADAAKFSGKVYPQLIQTIDIAPTILEYAGVKIPETMRGKSLQNILSGKSWRKNVFCENLWSTPFGNPRIESVRDERWKYIRYFRNEFDCAGIKGNPYSITKTDAALYEHFLQSSINGEQPVYEELFDLRSDPDETTNLASDEKYGRILRHLRNECRNSVKLARRKGADNEPYTNDLIQLYKNEASTERE